VAGSGTPPDTVVLVKLALIDVLGPPTWLALKMKLIGVPTNNPSASLTAPVKVTVMALGVARLIEPIVVSIR
jgi:hypothetical protein